MNDPAGLPGHRHQQRTPAAPAADYPATLDGCHKLIDWLTARAETAERKNRTAANTIARLTDALNQATKEINNLELGVTQREERGKKVIADLLRENRNNA